ncbi:MAG TPA: thioredoxin domain-containing protein [Patescibacteria group bacterium]|nr:thioredoxin domain-containing protein [Patescibacteria group bacterium]
MEERRSETQKIHWVFVILMLLAVAFGVTSVFLWKKVQRLENVAGVQEVTDQKQASLGGDPFSEENLLFYASQLGLDQDAFSSCLSDDSIDQVLQNDKNDGIAAGVKGTPTFFVNGRPMYGAERWATMSDIIEQELGNKEIPSTVKRVNLSSEGVRIGNPQAKVVVIEFSDFGCMYCAESYGIDTSSKTDADKDRVIFQLRQLAEEGKILFVYRHFATLAPHAAKASVCAAKQDKFWPYHDLLFEVKWQKI